MEKDSSGCSVKGRLGEVGSLRDAEEKRGEERMAATHSQQPFRENTG